MNSPKQRIILNKENQNKDLSKVEQRIKLLVEENQRLNQSLKNKLDDIQSLKQLNNAQQMELNQLRGIDCEFNIIKELISQKTAECDKQKRKASSLQQKVVGLEEEILILTDEKDKYCKEYLALQNEIHEIERVKWISDQKSPRNRNDEVESLKLQVNRFEAQSEHQQKVIKQLQEENVSVKRHLGCLGVYIQENEQLRKENAKISEEYQALIMTTKCN